MHIPRVCAQAGPSAPLELAEVRAFGTRIQHADTTLASPTRDAGARVRAAHDRADALRAERETPRRAR